jgi:hypothetical protein
MRESDGIGNSKEVKEIMSLLQTVLQTAPMQRAGYGGGSFIFAAIGAVSVLIISVGIFYVLMKLGSLLDAMKEKTESSTKK